MSWLVGVASAGSLCAILVSLISIRSIVNDISSLQDEVHTGMTEFKVMAEDTWTRLLKMHINPSGSSDAPATFATLLGRNKRQANSQCNCGPSSRGCPAGPPGPPGAPGGRGFDGRPGQSGRPGANGIALSVTFDTPGGCIKCPPGPPGPPGNPGLPGPAGRPGGMGRAGSPGNPGRAGSNGQPGSPGQPGRPGQMGREGAPGTPGVEYIPGPMGRDGSMGRPGMQGAAGRPGSDGRPGNDGPPGRAGRPGQMGRAGLRGEQGLNGSDGLPGSDAAYCPCPSRSPALAGFKDDDVQVNYPGSAPYRRTTYTVTHPAPSYRTPAYHREEGTDSFQAQGYKRARG